MPKFGKSRPENKDEKDPVSKVNVIIEVSPRGGGPLRGTPTTLEEAGAQVSARLMALGAHVHEESGTTVRVRPEGAPENAGGLRGRPVRSRENLLFSAEMDTEQVQALEEEPGVEVWPDAELRLTSLPAPTLTPDCTFTRAATMEEVQALLGVQGVWDAGFRGQGIAVAILDDGVHRPTYPVVGGMNLPHADWGTGHLGSHGSMCAADVLVAAPNVKLLDYPIVAVDGTFQASAFLPIMHQIIVRRQLEGLPHVLNASFSLTGVPPRTPDSRHPAWNAHHPMNRKIQEIVAAGVVVVFSAGNCGGPCADSTCDLTTIGPGVSINGLNSLPEVITVAAVNADGVRLGYSGQGPGVHALEKPDVAAFSHFHAHFGPGRPGGLGTDSGTSASAPLTAGVAALLLSANRSLRPDQVKQALIRGAQKASGPGWDADLGYGVVNAGVSCQLVRQRLV